MSISSVTPPYPLYTGTDGQPLEAGYIWIGQPFLDGRTYPKQAYWDGALTIPAGQPIRTINGYASQSGSPGRLFVDGDYSTLVLDKRGMQVYYAPSRLLDAPLTYESPFYARGNGTTRTFALPASWAAYTNNTHLQFWIDGIRVYPDQVTVAGGNVTFANAPPLAEFDNIYGEVATVGPEATGYVRGPVSSTDNAIALWDGTTGDLLKNGVTYNNIPVTATGTVTSRTVADRFQLQFCVLDYGAVGDLSQDDAPYIQDAIDAAALNGGGMVYVPSGFYRLNSAITLTNGVGIYGDGWNSVLRYASATGDAITVASNEGVIIDGLRIDTSVTHTDVNSAGIRLKGDGTGINLSSRLNNLLVTRFQNNILVTAANNWTITNSWILDHRLIGIDLKGGSYGAGTADTDTGQSTISGCVIQDLNIGTSTACVRYRNGGDVRVVANKIIGGQIGVDLYLDEGPTGTLIIEANSLEQHTYSNIVARQATSGAEFANLNIVGNQISNLDIAVTEASIFIEDGTPTSAFTWLRNVTISGNTFNHAPSSVSVPAYVAINGGGNISVTGNAVYGGGKSPAAFASADAAIAVEFSGNRQYGCNGGLYGALGTGTMVLDLPDIVVPSGQAVTIQQGGATRVQVSAGGNVSLAGAAGAEALRAVLVPSAVNRIEAEGSASGGAAAYVRATGTDTDVNLYGQTRGAGSFLFQTNLGTTQFGITHTASATAYLGVTGDSAGFPLLSVQGSATTAGMALRNKGSTFLFQTGVGTTQFQVDHVASASRAPSAGGSNGSDPYFGTTAGNLRLQPNGTLAARFLTVASAVNSIDFSPGATGSSPYVSFTGSDTNVGGQFFSRGAGAFSFASHANTGSVTQFQILATPSAAAYARVAGATAGGNPEVSTNSGALALNPSTKAVIFPSSASDPSVSTDGAVYYNTGTNKLKVRAGGVWVDLH